MATRIVLHHPSGVPRCCYVGFSWTTALFGPWPMACRGEWGGFFGSLVLAAILGMLSLGTGALLFYALWAFQMNRWHAYRLLEKGYRPANRKDAAVLLKRLGVAVTSVPPVYL
jgi:hypothetical protein